MPPRDLSRFVHLAHQSFGSLRDFLTTTLHEGVSTIDYNGSPLDLLCLDRGHPTTLVTFHSAMSPNMRSIPVFAGLGIAESLGCNIVSISDPTLEFDSSLTMAWFLGNARQPLQHDLIPVLDHALGSINSQHTVFFGASAGGFAALYYSAWYRDSLALPMNPQVIVRDYDEGAATAYARAGFGARHPQEAEAYLSKHVTDDVRHLYKGRVLNTVAYVQNAMDTHHLFRQLVPFLIAVPRSPRVYTLVEDWGMGHVPPPKELVRTLLNSAVSCLGDWPQALESNGFIQAPDEHVVKRLRAAAEARRTQ